MDFLPQFKDNTQDVSGIPANDAMAQLELQRKLKMAEALKNSQVPQGQIIGGHYVAPSWTQQLASAYGTYKGKKSEEEAIKKYGEYEQSKEQRMADALKKLGGAFEPKTVTSTEMQSKDIPLEQGVNVATSPFSTTDQVNATSPYNTQNMTGVTTQQTPVTTTSTAQPTLSDIEKAFGQYASDIKDPKLLASILTGKYEKMLKANEPVKLGAGEAVYSATGTKMFGNPKEGAKFTNIQQDKAGNSFGLNTETNQWEQLPGSKMATESWSAPYKVGGEFVQRNANTGEIRKAYGTAEGDKAPAGYIWNVDNKGQKTLTAIPGGPADKAANPTKEQSDAYTYSTRMESADKILNDLEGKYSPLSVSVKVSGKTAMIPGGQTVVNKLLSANDQKAEQAQRNFINAVLRRESGATIQPYEFDNANMQYFPQEGDSAEVLAQKRANRREAIEGLKKASGSMNKPSSGVVNFEDLK